MKGEKFKNHRYIGDPINAVRIFNEKEVDELVFFDISATENNREPAYKLIGDIASEAFMPLAYGGGIKTLEQATKLFKLGVEKVILNTSAFESPELITAVAARFGSQSIVVSIDFRKAMLGGYEVVIRNGRSRIKMNPVDYAKQVEQLGAGELILTSIDREGTGKGIDAKLSEEVVDSVDIPVVLQGGLLNIESITEALRLTGASAVAAGRMCVFHGKHKAVLITYPKYEELEKQLNVV